MKTLRFLAVAGMIAIAGTASAQFVNSGSTTATTQSTQRTGARLIKDTRDYNRFEFGYLPSTMTIDEKGEDDWKAQGFEVGYIHGFNLTKKLPLFLEFGGQIQFRTFKTPVDEEDRTNDYYYIEDDDYYGDAIPGEFIYTYKENMLSLNIPINLTYRLNVTKDFAISPYFGFDFRINLMGKGKTKLSADIDSDYGGDYTEDDVMDDFKDRYEPSNLFDKDDQGKDYVWKRFQAGWHIGVNFDYKALHIGVNYGTDMNELAKKTKLKTTTVALGFNF